MQMAACGFSGVALLDFLFFPLLLFSFSHLNYVLWHSLNLKSQWILTLYNVSMHILSILLLFRLMSYPAEVYVRNRWCFSFFCMCNNSVFFILELKRYLLKKKLFWVSWCCLVASFKSFVFLPKATHNLSQFTFCNDSKLLFPIWASHLHQFIIIRITSTTYLLLWTPLVSVTFTFSVKLQLFHHKTCE